MTSPVVQLVDRPPVELLDPEEVDLLRQVMHEWLGDYDIHDMLRDMEEDPEVTSEDMANVADHYDRIGKLYYAFTGNDFLCGHGYISNWEGRNE